MKLLELMIWMLHDPQVEGPCPAEVSIGGRRLKLAGERLLYRSALAWLSGQVESITSIYNVVEAAKCGQALPATEEQILSAVIEAADYGQQLYEMGVISDDQLQGTLETIMAAVKADAERNGLEIMVE